VGTQVLGRARINWLLRKNRKRILGRFAPHYTTPLRFFVRYGLAAYWVYQSKFSTWKK
jgi:hypothetical protein